LLSISILVPAYNEEKRLPSTLAALASFIQKDEFGFVEVLVIDDGSQDRTAALVQEYSHARGQFRLVSNPGNRGKGYAVRHGMQKAQGDWVLFTDADLSSPLPEFFKLMAAVQGSGADGAIGSRALDRSLVGVHQPLAREFSGRVFNLHMRMIAGLPYRDTQCGFKLFSRRAARLIASLQRIERFGFDVEILYIARKHGFRILEVPVVWNDVAGTKVSLRGGLNAFADPWRVRLNDLRGYYR
jgi:glycosyltransferase involved in cell wall biosynthesis